MEEEQEPKKKPSLVMNIVKAVGIITVLVAVEMVAAAMLIPSAEQTAALARELAKASAGEDMTTPDEDDNSNSVYDEETREVELLSDSITRFNPETDATLNVQFSVYGIVLADEADEFATQFESNTSRIHEQIMLTIHGADTSELATAGLGLIKRQILEKTNRALGRPMLREVVFTKLNFIER